MIKYILSSILTLTLVGCGDPDVYVVEGQPGKDGIDGKDGKDGVDGQDGQDGLNGADGTQITVVQLCPPSHVPVYPSTFPEVALCINGNLYGVYSTNGGFMALLPPGGYHSNGVNSTCNFTILPNCGIQ